MRSFTIGALVLAGVIGGVIVRPFDGPHIGHCKASVEKPQISPKGSAPAEHDGGNNRSVTSGVTVHCK